MSLNAAGGVGGCWANEYSCAHGAQINLGDLTPYLMIFLFSDQEYTVKGDLTIICPSGPASTLPGLFQSSLPHRQACLGIFNYL